MAIVEISRIQVRRGQENQTGIPVLDSGEFGWASDTERLYIGLRRIDGGARDANVRILTENDLRNFFSSEIYPSFNNTGSNYTFRVDTFIATTSTSIGPYMGGTWTNADLVVRSVQNKLDDFVNVRDFGAVGDGINDDYGPIQRAIDHLFLRDIKDENEVVYPKNTSTEKILYIPSGRYRISNCLKVPKKTKIQGEGKENTILLQINSGSGIFRTVGLDSIPGSYIEFIDPNTNNIASPNEPSYVSIENLTLYDQTGWPTGKSMIEFDVSSHSHLKNVRLRGSFDKNLIHRLRSTTSTAYAGVALRGYSSLEYNSKNIKIENCQFEDLEVGIVSNYDVDYVTIDKCYFNNLYKGISLNDPINAASNYGARYFRISNNSFDEVLTQGIFVGTATTISYSNIISQNNRFTDVGNWGAGDGVVSNTYTSIISFYTKGAISENDYFSRQHTLLTANTNIYYPALVTGHTNIANDSIITVQLSAASTSTVIKFPLIGTPQYLTYKYHIYNYSVTNQTVDRRGTLEIYVPFGTPQSDEIQFTDNYNYRNADGNVVWDLLDVNSTSNYVQLKINNLTPIGNGATFQVTKSPYPTYTGVTASGTYTVVRIGGGQFYQIGDVVQLPGTLFSTSTFTSSSPANDIIITVTGVLSGGILNTFTYIGTATNIINTTTFATTTGTIVNRIGGNNETLYIDYQQNIMLT